MLLRHKGNTNIKMGRLYGTAVENKEFPVPGRFISSTRNQRNYTPDPELKEIILHHRIRRQKNSCSKAIIKYDKKIQTIVLCATVGRH